MSVIILASEWCIGRVLSDAFRAAANDPAISLPDRSAYYCASVNTVLVISIVHKTPIMFRIAENHEEFVYPPLDKEMMI